MSRTITDEKIKLSIIIDGNDAQKELLDLEKATRKLTEENKTLNLEKKALERQGKKESEQYKALTATIKQNTAEIAQNKTKMSQLQNEIGLTGLTMNQLTQKATVLRMTLKNLIPGSADYQKYKAELAQVTARIGELSGKAQQSKLSLSSMADGFNKYQGLALSFIAGLTGIVFSIQKIIDINGKLSDAQSDVMKTTGMNKKEVDELTKSFGLLETRTSRIDLLKIAEQGGRIGIMKDEIGGFVNVMNKATVALGDSFSGGAEEVANKLGKIKFLFQETKDLGVEQAYNSIGSAINDLGANGVASEANIAEFTTRIGSLTDVLKPTIQETLALGTAFEESGIEAEVSARAYNIFMKQASTESAKFAKVMGISQKAVEDMINENPLDFMMKFAEGMRGMDATKTAKTLDFLGVNADGANKVIGAMGNNMGRFRELIDLSNNSFASGTSLINEYNIKNNNLAATLEKINKTVAGWFSSDTFVAWLTASVSWLARLIGATEEMDSAASNIQTRFINFVKVLAIVITAYVSYNSALKLVAFWTNTASKATELYNAVQGKGTIISGLFRSAILLLQAVFFVITGQMSKATNAMRLFNLTVSQNPLGFLLAALVAIGGAFWLFKKNSDEAANSIKKLSNESSIAAEINKKFTEDFGKASSQLKEKIQPLIDVLNNQNVSLETRKQAYEKLISIAPEFTGTVDKEFMATSKLNDVYTEILQKMSEKMRFQAMQGVLQSKYNQEAKAIEQLIKAENKLLEAEKEKADWDSRKSFKNAVNIDLVMKVKAATEEVTAAQNNLTTAEKNTALVSQFRQKQIEDLTLKQKQFNKDSKEYIEIQSKINALLGISTTNKTADPGKSKFNVPTDTGSGKQNNNPNSTAEDIAKLKYEKDLKYSDLSLKLQRELEDAKVALMEEGYAKEMTIENLRYKRQMQDLERQKVDASEMIKLDADIAKAKNAKDMTKYNELLKIKEIWAEKNKKIDGQINELEISAVESHNQKVGIIQERAATKSIKDLQEQHNREKIIRETAFLAEINGINDLKTAKDKLKEMGYKDSLSAIKTLEEAKTALKKQFNVAELNEEEKHLNEVLAKFDEIVKKNGGTLIDLSLLTPEQIENFKKEAESLGLTLQQLIDKKNELLGVGAGDKQAALDKLGLGGQADILGFNQNNWDAFFQNLKTGVNGIESMVFAVSALSNLWGQYDKYLQANEAAKLRDFQKNANIKKSTLKKQLDEGYISQKEYDRRIKQIDDDVEKRKIDIEYKQAKRQRTIALMNVVVNTAQAIMSIWAQVPKYDYGGSAAIMTAMVTGLGALQAATILKTPLPAKGYEDGLYGDYVKREQDGKVFKSTGTSPMRSGLYSKPRILVGEGPGDMPEMVIDKQAYRQLSPETRNALLREIRGIKGFENGYYNDRTKRVEVPQDSAQTSSTASNNDLMLMACIERNTAAINELRNNPLIAIISSRDYKSIRELDQALKTYNKIKDQSKK